MWMALNEALRASWGDCTRVANWATRQLAQAEPPRTAGQAKLSKHERVYLYPGARALAPDLTTGSVVALLHSVEGRYRARRFDCIWRCAEALPSYRYPTPLPLGKQVFSVLEHDGRVVVSAPIRGERWSLLLAGGKRHRRAVKQALMIARGEAVAAELVLLERPRGSKRHSTRDPRDAGATRRGAQLMAKLVAWFPREPRGPASGQLMVWTNADGLLAYRRADDEGDNSVKWIRGDHILRLSAQRRRLIDRLSDDLKRELRWPRRTRRRMVSANHPRLRRLNDAIGSALKEAARLVCGVALRRRCSSVSYQDSDRSFVAELPWAALRERMLVVLGEAGITFHRVASGEVVPDGPAALASTELLEPQ